MHQAIPETIHLPLLQSSWRCPAPVVDDLLHNALDEALALREVQVAQLAGALAVRGVGLEDRSLRTLTLGCSEHNMVSAPRASA
jgi:hypothetical protein